MSQQPVTLAMLDGSSLGAQAPKEEDWQGWLGRDDAVHHLDHVPACLLAESNQSIFWSLK